MSNPLFGTRKPSGSNPLLASEMMSFRAAGGIIEISGKHRRWLMDGKLHREDGPAIEADAEEWFVEGKRHRDGGPAYVRGKDFEYWQNGKLHRQDGPAVVYENGDCEWYQDGRLHREDGPAIKTSSSREWYSKGVKHRIGEPAVEYTDGGLEYWENGVPHRIDGPSVIKANGQKLWHYLGKALFSEEQLRLAAADDLGLVQDYRKFTYPGSNQEFEFWTSS